MPVRKNKIKIQQEKQKNFVEIKGGLYTMGYNGTKYCYDIELPEHKTYLENFKIGIFPITNKEYLEFMQDGGYGTYKHWLSDGWEKVKSNKWNSQCIGKKLMMNGM